VIAATVSAVLLGVGLGSLLHGLTERDWRSARVGTGLLTVSALIGLIAQAAAAVNA
jgi:hypothetical protein